MMARTCVQVHPTADFSLMLEDDDPMPHPPTDPGRFAEPLIVALPHRFVVSTRREFRDKIISHVEKSGARNFVCDCAGTTEIDPASWGALCNITRYVREAGGSFKLRGLPPDLARNLAALRADGFVELWTGDAAVSPAVTRDADR